MNAGYLILAKWITGAPLSDVVHCHSIFGGNNEKSDADVGSTFRDGSRTTGKDDVKTYASTFDVSSALAQLRENAELGGEEILQYLLREIQKWEVSEL